MTEENNLNYYQVDVEYIQKTSLLVSAPDEKEAQNTVIDSVNEDVDGFRILAVKELTAEEKDSYLEMINNKERVIN